MYTSSFNSKFSGLFMWLYVYLVNSDRGPVFQNINIQYFTHLFPPGRY